MCVCHTAAQAQCLLCDYGSGGALDHVYAVTDLAFSHDGVLTRIPENVKKTQKFLKFHEKSILAAFLACF